MELVITEYMNNIICAWFKNERLIQVCRCTSDTGYHVGDIFVGKVKNIVKNINAAFIDIGADELCFMQFADCDNIKREEEIIVQVVREGIRTKQPVVSQNISITGRLLIINDKKNINISKKIKDKTRRNELKELLSEDIKQNGFIVRTNATNADNDSIISEKESLIKIYDNIISKAKTASVYSKLYKAPSDYISAVRDSYAYDTQRIITDIPEIYNKVKSYVMEFCPDMADILSLYEDKSFSLDLLFGLTSKIKKALNKKVWLDSGAYIIIDVTEACTVIDVNSGKMIKGKKDAEQTFFNINCEAAEEIMLQLRLRNLSGIIIIDFIDMKSPEYNNELVRILSGLASKDVVSCNVVDITGLGLVEMTRKKQNRPVYEQFSLSGDELTII